MALPRYDELLADPVFRDGSPAVKKHYNDNYWKAYLKENPADEWGAEMAANTSKAIEAVEGLESASPITQRALSFQREALNSRIRAGVADKYGLWESQEQRDNFVNESRSAFDKRKSQLEKTLSLFDPEVDKEMQPTWDTLQKRALEGGVFGERSIRADSMSGPMGNALAGQESQGATKAARDYARLRDSLARDFNLEPAEVDDLVKHRMGLQKDPVSRDAAGGIHIKPELLSQGSDAVVSHIEKLPVTDTLKESMKEVIPLQLSAYKQSVVNDVRQNHPQLAKRLRFQWNGDVEHDFNVVLTQLNPEKLEQAAEGVTGGLLRGVGGAVYAGSLFLDKALSPLGIDNIPQEAAEETINAGKAMQSQQQLSKQIFGKSLQVAGLDVGDIGSVGYSLIESVGVGAATGGASALISADRIARAGKVGKTLLGAAKRMAGVAPLGGLYGLQQGIDVKERGGSDLDALVAGATEMGVTMGFSGVKLGGSDDLGVLLANPEMRKKMAKSVARAWGEVGLGFTLGTVGESLEESTIALMTSLYVESKLNPGMTVNDLKANLIETAKLSALPGGVAGTLEGVASQGKNLFRSTANLTTEQAHAEADARYKAAAQENLPEDQAQGGTDQTRGTQGVAPRQQVSRAELESELAEERAALEAVEAPTEAQARRLEALQGTPEEVADRFGLEIVEEAETPTPPQNEEERQRQGLQEVAPRSQTPSQTLAPKATENVEPRPPGGGGREGRAARIAWDDANENTHNPDGTPIQPTLLDETVQAISKAGKLTGDDAQLDAIGSMDVSGTGTAVKQLLDDGWNWNGERMENPANPSETPLQGLQRIRAARDSQTSPAPSPISPTESLPEGQPAPEEGAGQAPKLTPEAEALLAKGGTPMSVTSNLERIAKENGIEVTNSTRPGDIIDALRAKQTPQPTSENQVQETSRLAPQQGQPPVETPAAETQEGAAQREGEGQGQEGQVIPARETFRANAQPKIDEVVNAPLAEETGATFNVDGTVYEGGGIVLPGGSKNLTTQTMSADAVHDFMQEQAAKVSDPNTVKFGIYKFPNSDQVSVDINIIVDPSRREEAIAFGKELGQESVFDLDTFQNIKTGADGKNPKTLTDEEFAAAARRFAGPAPTTTAEAMPADVPAPEADLGVLTDAILSAMGITREEAGSMTGETLMQEAEAAIEEEEIEDDDPYNPEDNDADPEALPLQMKVDADGKPVLNPKGKPRVQTVGYDLLTAPSVTEFEGTPEDTSQADPADLHYKVTKPAQQKVKEAIESGAADAIADKLVVEAQRMMKIPAVAAGKGWYSRMRDKLLKAFGLEDARMFSHLLGTTSAKTPVENNFVYAVDLMRRFKRGEFNRNIRLYQEMVRLDRDGKLADAAAKRGILSKADQKEVDPKKLRGVLKAMWISHYDLLPRQTNGKLFGSNSLPALKAMSNLWLVGKITPKTPQFSMNLNGESVQATIDVWAARLIRRLLYAGRGTPWRIQPKAEEAVSDEDFYFAQEIFRRAANKLGMNPDDLQAIVWFGEKEIWEQNGWTGEIGAFKSSFDEVFDVFFPTNRPPRDYETGRRIVSFLQAERLYLADKASKAEFEKAQKNAKTPAEVKAVKQQQTTRRKHELEYKTRKAARGVPAYIADRRRSAVSKSDTAGPQGTQGVDQGGRTDLETRDADRGTETLQQKPERVGPTPAGTIAAFRNKTIRLTHWSNDASLKQTDPKKHGTAGAGEELKRQRSYPEIYQNRTYFGFGKYRKEQQIGPHRYSIEVDGNSIYDYKKDPLDLFPSREDLRAAGQPPFDRQAAYTLYEKRIKEAGFAGYVHTTYNAGALFTKAKVSPEKPGNTSLPTDTGKVSPTAKDTLKQDTEGPKGQVTFKGLSEALIEFFRTADPSTAAHESIHVVRRFLLNKNIPPEKRAGITDEMIDAANAYVGATDSNWTVPQEEKFARAFERYLWEGVQTGNAKVDSLFAKITEFMRDVYKSIKGSSLDVGITPELRELFDSLLTRGERLKKEGVAPTKVKVSVKERGAPAVKPAAKPAAKPTQKFKIPELPSRETENVDDFGVRMSVTNTIRRQYGMPDSNLKVSMTDQEAWDEALLRVARADAYDKATSEQQEKMPRPPLVGPRLVQDLIDNPRNTDKVEKALLAHEGLVRERAVERARVTSKKLPENASRAQRASANTEINRAVENLQELLDVIRLQGSRAGLALQAMKLVVNRQFELSKMLADALSAKNAGSPVKKTLSNKEIEEITKLSEKINDLVKEREELEAALNDQATEIRSLLDQLEKERAKSSKKPVERRGLTERVKERAQSARERLRARFGVERLEQGEERPEVQEQVNPLENHPDLGVSIGSGIKDGSFEQQVLNHSQQMQRGYPEIYATIQTSLPKNLRPIGEYATGIRTAIYEHIGDLAHRAGSSELGAMKDKIRRHALTYGNALTSKLKQEIGVQDENNAAFQIAVQKNKVEGNYDFEGARNSPQYESEVSKSRSYNKLLDVTYAAMYSRLQSFTPLQAAGRNMAIAFGTQRYALYHNLADKIDEFFKAAEQAGIKSENLYKLGFNVEGVNNLSRTNNKLSDQWETNKRLIQHQLENPTDTTGERARSQLQDQISYKDLSAPIEMLDSLIAEIKRQGEEKGVLEQRAEVPGLTEADYARHAELEAKHNAGTITDAERQEAQELVDAGVRKQVSAALPLWKRLAALLPKVDPYNTTETSYPRLNTDPELFFSEAAHPQAFELGRAAKMTDEEKLVFNKAAVVIRKVRNSPDYNRALRQLGDEKSNIFKLASAYQRMPLQELTEDDIEDLEVRAELATFQGDRMEVAASATEEATAIISILESFRQPTFTRSWDWPDTDPFTGVPLDQRFNPESPSILYQEPELTPEQVARHAELEAKFNAGTITPEEKAEAKALVEKAARAAGYEAETYVHETTSKEEFTEFKVGGPNIRPGQELTMGDVWGDKKLSGHAIWFRPKNGRGLAAHRKGEKRQVAAKLRLRFPLMDDRAGIKAYGGFSKDFPQVVQPSDAARLKELGRDSVVYLDGNGEIAEVLVFDPSQIKSADPFTGVPLRERFQADNPSILYQEPELTQQDLEDLADIYASYILEGNTSDQAMERLSNEFGPVVDLNIDPIQETAEAQLAKTAAGSRAKTPTELFNLLDPDKQEIDNKLVFNMVRGFINMGVPKENVLKKVLSLLQQKFPDLTYDEVSDAFTGYGKVKFPSQEEDLKAVRELRNIERIQRQIRELEAGNVPKKTGQQRDAATQRIRELQKELKEAFRAAGIKHTTSPAQLKGALDAIKTRLKNEIEDLDRAITTKTKITRKKTQVEYDQDILDLQKKRDEKRKEYDRIFGVNRRELTDAQKLKAAVKALNKRITEERELARQGLLDRVKSSSKPVSDAEVERLRSTLNGLVKARRDAKAALYPSISEEGRVLSRAKGVLKRQIEYYEKLKAGIPTDKKAPLTTVPDEEMVRLMEARDEVRKLVKEMRREQRRADVKSPEARARAAAIRALEKSVADLEARVKRGDLSKKSRSKMFGPLSEAETELKKRQEAARAALKALEAAKLPSREERREQALLKAAQTRLTKIQERIRTKDYVDPPKKDRKVTRDLARIDAQIAEANAEFRRMQQQFRLDNTGALGKAWYYTKAVLQLRKIIVLGLELGVIGRQGNLFTLTGLIFHQPRIARTMYHAFRAFSREAEIEHYNALMTRPNAMWDKTGGIKLHSPHDEGYHNKEDLPDPELLNKLAQMRVIGIPADVVLGVERFTRAFLNQARVEMFDALTKNISRSGEPNIEEVKIYGNATMNATGRGSFRNQQLDTGVALGNTLTISTRWLISRAKLAVLEPVWTSRGEYRGTLRARGKVLNELYLKTLVARSIVTFAILAAKAALDDEWPPEGVSLNPLDSNFLAIKYGRAKLDIFGGQRQLVNFIARLGMGYRVGADGQPIPLRGEGASVFKGNTDTEVWNFFRNRANVNMGLALDLLRGEFFGGEKVTWMGTAKKLVSPIMIGDTIQLYKEFSPAEATALWTAMFMGASVTIPQDRPKQGKSSGTDKLRIDLDLKLDLKL